MPRPHALAFLSRPSQCHVGPLGKTPGRAVGILRITAIWARVSSSFPSRHRPLLFLHLLSTQRVWRCGLGESSPLPLLRLEIRRDRDLMTSRRSSPLRTVQFCTGCGARIRCIGSQFLAGTGAGLRSRVAELAFAQGS
jgi:hypothetical protein